MEKKYRLMTAKGLADVDGGTLSLQMRNAYFVELYRRLGDGSVSLSAEERALLTGALKDKMAIDDRMTFVFNENGEYGGNQENPAIRFETDPEFQNYTRNLLSGMTDDEIRIYLNNYNSVGCGYMATANCILAEYANKPDEFQNIFGFPLYIREADGSIHPNFEILAISIYYYCGRDGRNGKKNKGIFPKDAIEKYLTPKDVDVTVSRTKKFPSIDDIRKDLEIAPVPLSLNPCIMYDANEIRKETGAHAITVTGITENGDLIVSSWGVKYTVKRSDYDTIRRIRGEYVVYDKTGMEAK